MNDGGLDGRWNRGREESELRSSLLYKICNADLPFGFLRSENRVTVHWDAIGDIGNLACAQIAKATLTREDG